MKKLPWCHATFAGRAACRSRHDNSDVSCPTQQESALSESNGGKILAPESARGPPPGRGLSPAVPVKVQPVVRAAARAPVQIGGSEELPLGHSSARKSFLRVTCYPQLPGKGEPASVKSRRNDWLAGLVADPQSAVPGGRKNLGWAHQQYRISVLTYCTWYSTKYTSHGPATGT
jgi:hypothetical protein